MKAYFVAQLKLKEELRTFNGARLVVPALTPQALSEVTHALCEAQQRLRQVSIGDIVLATADTAALWMQRDYPLRKTVEEYLPRLTGFSVPMVSWALDWLFGSLTKEALWQLLSCELGDPKVLDEFVPKPNAPGRHRAFGPRLVTHVFSGNIIGISVQGLVFALLCKSASVAKPASEEPLLAALFAESLRHVFPELAKAIAVLWWEGGDEALEPQAFEAADVVIAYGSDDTIAHIHRRVPPHVRFLAHGHRISLGVVSRESVSQETAQKAALDVSLFDQKGCLSAHAFYVEQGGRAQARQFVSWLAEALQATCRQFPPGRISAQDAAYIQNFRATHEMTGSAVFAPPRSLDWTVIYDPDPHLLPSCLYRTALVKPVEDIEKIPQHLAHLRGKLAAVSLAVPEQRAATLAEKLGALGVSRLCPIGKMQHPPLTWHHDGRFNLLDLLHFVDWEE